MAKSPTQCTLDYWRKLTSNVDVVEHSTTHWFFDKKTKERKYGGVKKHDMFGFIDVVVLLDGCLYGIQTTTKSNIWNRKNKILTGKRILQKKTKKQPEISTSLIEVLRAWVSVPGARFIIEGWYKPKHRWEAKRIEFDELTEEWIEIGDDLCQNG